MADTGKLGTCDRAEFGKHKGQHVKRGDCESWREQPAVEPAQASTHFYISTACEHDLHKQCRLFCKYCRTLCQCAVCNHDKPAQGEPRWKGEPLPTGMYPGNSKVMGAFPITTGTNSAAAVGEGISAEQLAYKIANMFTKIRFNGTTWEYESIEHEIAGDIEAYAALKVREATQTAQPDADSKFMAVHAQLLDEIANLRRELATCRNNTLEEAAKVCWDLQQLNPPESGRFPDYAAGLLRRREWDNRIMYAAFTTREARETNLGSTWRDLAEHNQKTAQDAVKQIGELRKERDALKRQLEQK